MVSKNHEIRSCICSKLHLHSDAGEFRLKIYDAILFLSLRFQWSGNHKMKRKYNFWRNCTQIADKIYIWI